MPKQKLIPGKTVIGHIEAKNGDMIQTFEIRYGNVANPPINGKLMHLEAQTYRDLLDDFLDSAFGQEFEKPTEEEIRQAAIVVNNMEAHLKRVQEEKKKEEEAVNNQPEPSSETENSASEPIQNDTEDPVEPEENNEEKPEKRGLFQKKNKKEKPEKKQSGSSNPIVLILLSMALLLSLGLNAFQIMTAKNSEPVSTAMLDMNGNKYEIPISSIPLEEGESRLMIYGITTKKENGKLSSEVIALGEYPIAKKTEEKTAEKPADSDTEKEKNTEPETETEDDEKTDDKTETKETTSGSDSGNADEKKEE